MASYPVRIGLPLMIMCLLFYHTHAQRSAQRKEELIQDTVRKFLGVKTDERTVPAKPQSLPPRYMMDLYEKYRSGQTPMQGNTVRSILAMRDKINSMDMLIFNLTGLKSTEQILQSKLYLLKRRKAKDGKKRERSNFKLNVGCLPLTSTTHEIDISLTRQKSEWHSYDISESVVSCRRSRNSGDTLLGLTLEVRRQKGSYKKIAFKRLVKPNSQPFLLIFSEDSQNLTSSSPISSSHDDYDGIGDLLRAKANEEGFLPDRFRLPKRTQKLTRYKRSHGANNKSTKMKTFLPYTRTLDTTTDVLNSRSDRVFQSFPEFIPETIKLHYSHSDFENLLNHFMNFVQHFSFKSKHMYYNDIKHKNTIEKLSLMDHLNSSYPLQTILNNDDTDKVLLSELIIPNRGRTYTSNSRVKRSIADTLLYSTEEKESDDSEATMKTIKVIDEKYLQQDKSGRFRKTKRRNKKQKTSSTLRKQKKKRRRNRKLPFWWSKHDDKYHAQDIKHMCQRKTLLVDFAQLGWDDWIISPKSFNARYCSGSCTFPIIKHTETSNHAAVQSLIHAMGLNKDVPTPSCVPSSTSSLTLLYFDEHGGLVLKSYPNMIVEKCGCR